MYRRAACVHVCVRVSYVLHLHLCAPAFCTQVHLCVRVRASVRECTIFVRYMFVHARVRAWELPRVRWNVCLNIFRLISSVFPLAQCEALGNYQSALLACSFGLCA